MTMLPSINDAKTFDEVVRIREEVYAANLRGDNHFEDVLVGLYKEDTHFLYELLQNADDVNASEIEITLSQDELVFWHNGTKDFNLRDVIAITGIGAGTKKDEPNKIGKFGIGFKSVFSVTESPQIFSGEFNFEIRHFSVPSLVERSTNIKTYGTTFVLSFNHREKRREDIYADIEKALNQLDANAFMFLNHIENVSWTSDTCSSSLIKEVKADDGYIKMSVVTSKDEVLNEYLIFTEPLSFSSNLSVSIAYKTAVINGKAQILPMPNSRLSVYFFTETVTFLNFILNGPFQTSSTRESVDGSKQHNQMVLTDIAGLYEKSLLILKDKGFLDEVLLEILPIDRTNCHSSFVYERLYKTTLSSIKNNSLLPTKNGMYCNSEDALLARGAELTHLLSKQEDIELLFKKKVWLSTQITGDRTPKLRDYLIKEHGVSEITYPSFCRSISKEFIERKSDKWLSRFYMECGARREKEVWQILRSKPIIRTGADKVVAPFVNGSPAVFLPSPATPKAKAVKSTLLANDEAKEFLIGLGLGNINIVDNLRMNILPKFIKSDETDSRLKYFDVFFQAYKSAHDDSTRNDILNLLKKEKIILFENAKDGSESWGAAKEGYIRSQELETLFAGCDYILFVSPKLFTRKKDVDNVVDFLVALGADKTLARIGCNELSHSRKYELRAGGSCTSECEENYNIHGLNYLLDNMTIERSRVLFALLAEQKSDYFEGEYSWGYSRSHSKISIIAHFVEILTNAAWIVNNEGDFIKPEDIKKQEVIQSYGIPNNAAILQVLSFMPDAIDLLPDEYKQRLELVLDIPIELLQKLRDEHDVAQKISPEEQVIEEEPGLGAAPIIEADPPVHNYEELEEEQGVEEQDSDNGNKTTGITNNNPSYTLQKRVVIRTADNKRKTIGDWAEEKVITSLQDRYKNNGYLVKLTDCGLIAQKGLEKIELKNMNVGQKNHPGYDFELLKNDEIIEYIEVKAKTSDEPEMFSVSGMQWEKAKILSNAGKGDMFFIYLVTSAGQAGAKIKKYKNPYKLWKEERLYADPVNIEL